MPNHYVIESSIGHVADRVDYIDDANHSIDNMDLAIDSTTIIFGSTTTIIFGSTTTIIFGSTIGDDFTTISTHIIFPTSTITF